MTRRTKPSGKEPKPEKAKPPRENRQLVDQNRKLLGKHYAARYGKKRGG